MNLLDATRIRESIGKEGQRCLESLEVFAELDSTNTRLLAEVPPSPGRFRVVLAEHQTAGRGRMGRRWESPPSTGICLSVSYTFRRPCDVLSCVTLAVGVDIVRLLEEIGVRGIGLKWPNDLIMQNAKLGGILTEIRSGAAVDTTVVVGLGINVDFAGAGPGGKPGSHFGRVIDLASCIDDLPSRCILAAKLVVRLCNTLAEFDSDGFARFHATWPAYDWLRGRRIRVDVAEHVETGVCEGVDTDGALFLRTTGGRKRIISGSILLNGQDRRKAS